MMLDHILHELNIFTNYYKDLYYENWYNFIILCKLFMNSL